MGIAARIGLMQRDTLRAGSGLESALSPMVPADTTRRMLLPIWLTRTLLIASCLSVVQGALSVSAGHEPTRILAWIGAALYVLAFLVSYERPSRPVFVLAAASVVLLSFTVSGNAAFVAAVATIAVSALRLSVRDARIIGAVTTTGFLVGIGVTSGVSARDLISPLTGLLFTFIAAESLRRLRAEQQRTQELLQEVIAGRDDRIRAAALDERARLAREMHDILAHTLSALSIQLEGARLLAEQRPDDPALVERIERAGRLTREGMAEAKRAVGSLRGEVLPGPDLLPVLAEDFERDTGVTTRLSIQGHPRDLAPDARLALYRVAQEALTNVRKHVDATSVQLTLCYADTGTELTIVNEGTEREHHLIGGGQGLNGMRERAELLGGRLEAGPVDSGFRVSLWVPV